MAAAGAAQCLLQVGLWGAVRAVSQPSGWER